MLANWAATAIENARLHSAEAERRGELEQSVRALEATVEIARAVAGETRIERILELIAKRGRALVAADGMLILLADGEELVVTVVAGALGQSLVGQRVPIAGSATGLALTSRRAQRLSDVAGSLRYSLADAIKASTGLLVPMTFHGRAVGVLAAFDHQGDDAEFSREDERMMQAFAASAATALATAQDVAAEGLRRSIAATEQERTHWARELHDETLQSLAMTRLTLASALREPEQREPRGADRIGDRPDRRQHRESPQPDRRPPTGGTRCARSRRGDRDARRPPRVTHEHRASSSRRSISRTSAAATRAGTFPEIEATLYRITQEALNNVLKHSNATTATVSVVKEIGTITLTIRDDGAGFDQSQRGTGFGLIGMREHVSLVEGSMSIKTAPGAGTTVEVAIPVQRASSERERPRLADVKVDAPAAS